MGLRTNQASGHQGLDWGHNLQQSGAPEMPTSRQSEPLKCPRCGSTNTKFCYFNNNNKSQPRHFCKSCKRHWTKGGILRNVPVGGCRKNKRPKISSPAVNFRTGFTLGANPAGDRKGASNLYQGLNRPAPPLWNKTAVGINVSVSPGKDLTAGNNTNVTDLTGLKPSVPEGNPNTAEFQFSSLEMNSASLIPTYEIGNIDATEKSTVTTANIDYPIGAWLGFDTSSCLMELPAAPATVTANYWNWSEIDVLTPADDLNISWDEDDAIINGEAKMKP